MKIGIDFKRHSRQVTLISSHMPLGSLICISEYMVVHIMTPVFIDSNGCWLYSSIVNPDWI
jgi:hypothetical protein